MMRSDMPKQIQAYRNGGGLMSLATVPMETEMAGQPHRLAYINPEEEELLLAMGGAGEPGPGGIVSYFLHNQESRDKIKSAISKAFGGGGSSNNNTQSQQSDDNDKPSNNVGFVDSLLMGFGLKEKTDAYYNATARSIARSQGSDRAQQYLDNNADNISNQSNITVNVTEEADKFYDDTPSGGGDDNVSVAVATGGGGGGGEDVTTTTTTTKVFEGLTDDQLGAQSTYLNRVADYMGQYTPEQLSDIGQRRGIYDQDFAPTRDEFMAITGVDEATAKALLSRQVGQSYDLRDWSKIMASDNPLEAAQAATAALYMTEGLYGAGQTISTANTVGGSPYNIIGETDQLYAYVKPYSPYNQRYGVGNVGIGIKTPDGVLLTDLGALSSPSVGENLARFGYGTEDIAELIDPIRQYYTENFEFNPSYYTGLQKVSDGRYVGNNRNVVFGGGDAQTDQYSQVLGQDVVIRQPDGTYAVMDTFGLGQGAISGENIDPFGVINNLQTNLPQTTTGDLATGQSYLFQTTPGFFGNSALNIMEADLYEAQQAAAHQKRLDDAAAAEAAKYSSGQPVMGSAGANTGLQNYTALQPAAGTSTAGIAGLPSTIQPAIQTPYTFTAYNPGTYNPVVGPLTLPPLG